MMEDFNSVFHVSAGMFLAASFIVLVFLIPARVVQMRHDYPSWILVFSLIPYAGPFLMLWAFALSTPKRKMEA